MEGWHVMETSGLCWLNSKNKGYLYHRQQGASGPARVLRAGGESLGREVVNRRQPRLFPPRLSSQASLAKLPEHRGKGALQLRGLVLSICNSLGLFY